MLLELLVKLTALLILENAREQACPFLVLNWIHRTQPGPLTSLYLRNRHFKDTDLQVALKIPYPRE